MPPLPTPEQIQQAGPWAVLAFVLILGIVVVATAFLKDVVVSGKRYRDDMAAGARRERLYQLQLRRNRETFEDALRQLAKGRPDVRGDVSVGREPPYFHD